MKEKFSASGDVEAWFKKNEEQPESDKDYEPLLNAGQLDVTEISETKKHADEVNERMMPPPPNVVPFPAPRVSKPVEQSKPQGWREDPANIMTESQAEAAIAEGNSAITPWFKHAEKKDEEEVIEPERKKAVGE